jgi:SpoIID/LytB domain protein
MRPRPFLRIGLLFALLLTGALPAGAADVVVTGGGLGHGIGMSQWGAQKMAEQGKTAEQILTHFYTGAQFGEVGDEFTQQADPLHIGIGQNLATTSFRPVDGNLTVCLAGQCHTAVPGQTWKFQFTAPNQCQLFNGAAVVSTNASCTGTITWGAQPGTKVFFVASGRTYARGGVILKPNDPDLNPLTPPTGFHVVVEVPLESYLYGLAEVPNNWMPEALQAQAIAARTYALYKAYVFRLSTNPLCGCHLFATAADQVYKGWDTSSNLTEAGTGGAHWKAAVDATAGKAMWHPYEGSSRALEAYYFSSTGDNTENSEDKWNFRPYLRSVDDPGARTWNPPERTFTYANFASKLGFQEVTWVNIVDRYDSGRPTLIEVQGKVAGSQTTVEFTSAQFLAELGLPSQWIWSVQGFIPPGADRVLLHDPATGFWTFRNANGTTWGFHYGTPGDVGFVGDWDCDGVETPGLYRRSTGFVYLTNVNAQSVADVSYFFGIPGDIPVAGDLDGDGCDTVSIYRPSQARFYVINRLGANGTGPVADYSFAYGVGGDVPFVGDWNGDGLDTPGLRRPSNGFVYLRNSNTTGFADTEFFYGVAGDVVYSGDWDANGSDSIGLYRPSTGTVFLRNALSTGVADIAYELGGSQHKAVAASY